jgi:hypothetical protein
MLTRAHLFSRTLLGHPNVRVLDGGIGAWRAAGGPTETSPSFADVPKTLPAVYEGASLDPSLVVNKEQVSIKASLFSKHTNLYFSLSATNHFCCYRSWQRSPLASPAQLRSWTPAPLCGSAVPPPSLGQACARGTCPALSTSPLRVCSRRVTRLRSSQLRKPRRHLKQQAWCLGNR